LGNRCNGHNRHSAVVALLPILAVYALVTLVNPSGLDSLSDEWRYLAFADHITHGFYAQTGGAPDLFLWHGPGLPLLLAPFVALDIPIDVTRIVFGPLVLFGVLLLFHRLVRLYLPPRQALLATYALGVYLPFLTVIETIHVEPLAALCFTAAALFFVLALRGGERKHAIAAGVALGFVALSRVEYGWVVLAALLASVAWFVVKRASAVARLSVTVTAVALIACLPWLGYTFAKTHKSFYWGNSGGLSLYWMTAPGTVGDWHGLAEPLRNPKLAASRPLFVSLRSLSPEDQDARLQREAVDNIKHDPKRYATNVGNNFGRLVFETPYSFSQARARTLLYSIPNAILLALILAAIYVAVRARRSLELELAPLAALTLLGFAVHLFVSGYARMVIPLVPVAAWLAVAVLARHKRVVAA
jgi:hypothetical protein